MHVGIIPDGTRRWCALHNTSLSTGYCQAMRLLGEATDLLYRLGASTVSLYLLSTDNLSRSKDELTAVINAEAWFCSVQVESLIRTYGIGVKIAGDLDRVPDHLRVAARKAARSQSKPAARRLYLCIAYNPFDEVRAACEVLRSQNTFIHEDTIMDKLWVSERLDLVLRTGGRGRISNFLPLQSGYAEIHFVDKLFNDLTTAEIATIVDAYQSSRRTFGT